MPTHPIAVSGANAPGGISTRLMHFVTVSRFTLIPGPSPSGRRGQNAFQVPLPHGEGFRVRVFANHGVRRVLVNALANRELKQVAGAEVLEPIDTDPALEPGAHFANVFRFAFQRTDR